MADELQHEYLEAVALFNYLKEREKLLQNVYSHVSEAHGKAIEAREGLLTLKQLGQDTATNYEAFKNIICTTSTQKPKSIPISLNGCDRPEHKGEDAECMNALKQPKIAESLSQKPIIPPTQLLKRNAEAKKQPNPSQLRARPGLNRAPAPRNIKNKPKPLELPVEKSEPEKLNIPKRTKLTVAEILGKDRGVPHKPNQNAQRRVTAGIRGNVNEPHVFSAVNNSALNTPYNHAGGAIKRKMSQEPTSAARRRLSKPSVRDVLHPKEILYGRGSQN